MKTIFKFAAIGAVFWGAGILNSNAAETRCGWIFLDDGLSLLIEKDKHWDFSDYVVENSSLHSLWNVNKYPHYHFKYQGNHEDYYCGCIEAVFHKNSIRISDYVGAQQKPLEICRKDVGPLPDIFNIPVSELFEGPYGEEVK